jgi:hypothetical protein
MILDDNEVLFLIGVDYFNRGLFVKILFQNLKILIV